MICADSAHRIRHIPPHFDGTTKMENHTILFEGVSISIHLVSLLSEGFMFPPKCSTSAELIQITIIPKEFHKVYNNVSTAS